MTYPSEVSPMRIVVLFADRFYANSVHRVVHRLYPRATISLLYRVDEAARDLKSATCDLFLTGVETVSGDIFDLLAWNADNGHPARRVFMITGRRELQVLSTLRSLQVQGVFDPEVEDPADLRSAIRHVMRGEFYWSKLVTPSGGLPTGQVNFIFARLTEMERLVFATIGDGCDDATGAERLQMPEATVQGVRCDLHRKLKVGRRGDLVRLAVQLGIVIFTQKDVIRPGIAALLAARDERRRRREARHPHIPLRRSLPVDRAGPVRSSHVVEQPCVALGCDRLPSAVGTIPLRGVEHAPS